jgi:hypothetical protein
MSRIRKHLMVGEAAESFGMDVLRLGRGENPKTNATRSATLRPQRRSDREEIPHRNGTRARTSRFVRRRKRPNGTGGRNAKMRTADCELRIAL